MCENCAEKWKAEYHQVFFFLLYVKTFEAGLAEANLKKKHLIILGL